MEIGLEHCRDWQKKKKKKKEGWKDEFLFVIEKKALKEKGFWDRFYVK